MNTSLVTTLGAILTSVIATFATSSFAQSAPSGVYVRNVSYAGSGCPAGSVDQMVRYHAGDLLIDFDDLIAESGPGIPLTAGRKTCQILIDLRVPSGWSYSVRSATYRGDVDLDAGATAVQTTSYYFQGQASTGSLSTTLRGPTRRGFTVTDNLTSSLWSPCGVNRALNINVQAKVTGSRNAYALMSLDSPFNLSHDVKLAWRRCN